MPTVAILAFAGVQALDVTGPLDVFAEANHYLARRDAYRLTVLGLEAGALACSNGMLLQPHACFEDVQEAPDLLLVPGGPGVPQQPRNERLCAWLGQMGGRAARVASICNGAFLLAHAGLLDQRRATTHWNDIQNLSARFPQITVQPDRIFVRDGHVYSSAGVTAGIDLALHLVYEDWGADVSLNVAKRLVVFTQRSGGQSQFSPYLAPHVGEESAMQKVQLYVLGHLDQDLSVDHLARVAAMSERNFARVFARETRVTPAEFVERARVDAARVLLESGSDPLKTIAHRCGFASAARMRAAFVKHLGVTALQYRQHFGAYAGEAARPAPGQAWPGRWRDSGLVWRNPAATRPRSLLPAPYTFLRYQPLFESDERKSMSTAAERVGPAFTIEGMEHARAETRRAIAAIAAGIRPGMVEEDAVAMAQAVIRNQGHSLSWHPTRVRFGPNTMLPMKRASAPGVVLGENDIFFIDIAPRVGHWEGDGGASFVVGDAPEYARCAADAERLFHEVRALWRDRKSTGAQLYAFGARRAREMGWVLNLDLPGHRVSDFPHAAIHTGALADYPECPSGMRWILEIHLTDPEGRFGAFFEDMLLEDGDYAEVPA